MKQVDIERFAFLYLCGKQDRKRLLGREKMEFSDFDRLTYLMDFMEMKDYSLELWNQYAGQFRKELQEVEELYQKKQVDSWQKEAQDQEHWLYEFFRNIPDKDAQKFFCMEYGKGLWTNNSNN